jgi:hypothetical protein
MPKPLRFQQRLDRYPPILIRLLTTRGRRADKWVPTDRQISDASGLSMAAVKRISYSTSWDDIPIGLARSFLMGCDIDLEKRRCFRRLEWMRRNGNFSHLRKSPLYKSQFMEMLDLWADADT